MNFPKGKWVQLPYEWIRDINFPKELWFSGVYVFLDNLNKKKIYYIGSSKCVQNRIVEHIIKKIIPAEKNNKEENWWENVTSKCFTIKVRKDKYRFEYLTLEARLIYKLNPTHNKAHRNTKKIKEEIKHDIKRLTERLKPVLLGEKKRLNHIDKEQRLIHYE